MNTYFKRNILSYAIMQAVAPAEQSGGTAGNAPMAEPTEQETAPVVVVPNTGNIPLESGREWGQKILAAEQGIKVAEASAISTRIDGLLACAKLETAQRTDFILGMQSAFGAQDGNRLTKTHQNYLGNLRRVAYAIEKFPEQWAMDKLMAHLTGQGDFAEKMEKLPKTGSNPGGGSNKGSGVPLAEARNLVSEVVKSGQLSPEQAEQAIKEKVAELNTPKSETNEPAKTEPANSTKVEPSTPVQGPLSTVPAIPSAPKVSQQAEVSTAEAIAMVDKLHDSQLDAIGAAYANRCKRSASPVWNDAGMAILDLLDTIEKQDDTKPAPMAANG